MRQVKIEKNPNNICVGTRCQQCFHISIGKLVPTLKFFPEKKMNEFELFLY